MPDVMISYARADARPFANRLAEALGRHCDAWLDTSDIEGGAEWLQSIQHAIAECKVFVAVRSPAASSSFWVRSERLFALNKRKPIVPVVPVDCSEDDLELISYQPVDFRGDFEKALSLLWTLVQKLSGSAPAVRADRATLEQAYLGRILLEHSVWQDLYTPMAAVAHLRTETAEKPKMVTLPAAIDPVFREFVKDKLTGVATRAAVEQRDYDDILPAVEQMRQLVILGDPGSGKTTTLWRIAVDLAQKAMSDRSRPLPVFARLGQLRPEQTVEQHLTAQLGDLGPFYQELWKERRLALLLDGLNELPLGNRTGHAMQIRTVVERARGSDLFAAVTCREIDYTADLDLNLPRRLVIAPLDLVRIRQFTNAYIKEPPGAGDELFWQMAGEEARQHWQNLQQWSVSERDFWESIAPPVNPIVGEQKWLFREAWSSWVSDRDQPRSLLRLARNPYMLFMLTQVFTLQARIPPNRGQLFSWFIDYLLLKRERLTQDQASRLTARLADLAYAMQQQGTGTGLWRDEALEHLEDEHQLYLAESANLLTGAEEIRFTHQLLQEFFAAHKLDRMMQSGGPASQFWPTENWWKPRDWDETAVLLAGLYSDDATPVLHWLRDANPLVAARCVAHSGATIPPAEREALRDAWLPRLTDERRSPTAQERAAVGRALGRLGLDNRPGVGLRPDGLPDVAWCLVQPGPFRMGGDADVEGFQTEPMTINIEYPFWIAKHPVTCAQYAAFVEQGGYRERRWWTGSGWEWKEGRTGPAYGSDVRWNISNHPVVGLTWYEAFAFTRWLNELARTQPSLLPPELRSVMAQGETTVIRLPTEAEREKAVRFPEGRKFAWGDEDEDAPANFGDQDPFRLKRTAPVGIFARGVSPCGAHDLCGNVFDWCLSLYREKYEYPEETDVESDARRVARGGSWLRSLNAARGAYREAVSPETIYDDQGFRLCASAPRKEILT